ncbi:molybdopterin-containing oxidoreductase family protein [Tengunoibacter tsumagoiensis]|uniref:Molybdopterin containing oxidoreductase n=1 Tax=Tengunoibacter tsumagoiensis TaxID=2014871 RepID=A0A402A1A6_9CHLR|nr:molybdopterin-dependent oxidoreductase [Tengunoibacter tsumagoiensis]GCE12894.1 molybdopterin containing oxidoreductase [Tengunoibacter tsumagoiensis]
MTQSRRQITTMCPMNCRPTQCGMTVEVEENRLLSIRGDQQNPDSRGFLCIRGQATHEIFSNPKRLRTPLRRIGSRGENRWEQCSWEDAYALLVNAIQQTQPERVGLWRGHGIGTTGVTNSTLVSRFGALGGFQQWTTSIVCWAMGGYGLGLTGTLSINTKEDMAANSKTILLWGATLASQPDLGASLVKARKRGAHIIQIDTRRTEVSRLADEVLLIPPGTDAALALALAHVILAEGLHNQTFIDANTLGFPQFAAHLQQYTPEWASAITGIEPERICQLARSYATQTPAMIVLGGSSMFKHQYGWESSRAISCLPALTGQLGIAGGGLGQRHGALPESTGLANVLADVTARMTQDLAIPSHMATITGAFNEGKIDVLLLLGTNMLSSFADSKQLAQGLDRVKLIVSYDLFMNETTRQCADLIFPATAWLEEIGLKQTDTHIYLMEPALQPEGECRSLTTILRDLAQQLSIDNFFPWQSEEDYVHSFLAAQQTETGAPLTLVELRQRGGYWQKKKLSHIAYQNHHFATPSTKIEFWSERARQAGLSPLPTYTHPVGSSYPLRFCQGRTLTAFHAFFDEGQALPTLAAANPGPELWIHPTDAQQRHIQTGEKIIIFNDRGQFEAKAHITADVLEGVVWMRDGWFGINKLTSGTETVSLIANEIVPGVPGGQAAYDAWVDCRTC